MTWNHFLRQYDAQGREKGDGYSAFDFEDMTDGELAQARAMMLERALAGDTIDVDGLRFVGDGQTARALREAEALAHRHGWGYQISRHQTLFVLTGDHDHLRALARWLDGRDMQAQERAAYALAFHALTPDFDAFIVDRIADGRHEKALLGLLDAWLALHGHAGRDLAAFQRNLPLIRAVGAAPPTKRRAMLRDATPNLA